MSPLHEQLHTAITAALAGEWEVAHGIVQSHNDPTACWIHAVLHKIEGDAWNSRYWYARTHSTAKYDDFDDPTTELQAIRQRLQTT